MIEKTRSRVLLFFQSVLFLGLISCMVQEPRDLRKTKYYAKKKPVGKPMYGTQTQTFFQEGSNKSATRIILQDNLLDGFYMRGQEVHDHILKSSNAMRCMAVHFQATDNSSIDGLERTLILAAFPQSFLNFSNNTREWYYFFKVTQSTENSNFCGNAAGIYTSVNKSYSFQSLSSNYKGSFILGKTVQIFDTSGVKVTSVASKHLSLQINKVSSAENPLTKTCSDSLYCQSLGFDCCSGGTCVKDGQKKSGSFENEPDYLQSVQDILVNSSNYKLYPQYYHVCTENPIDYGGGSGTGSTLDPYDEKEKRLTMLKELYDCITPMDKDSTGDDDSVGEMGICTHIIENASTNSSYPNFYTGGDDRNFSTTYSGTGTLSNHSIHEIIHAGEKLFSNGTTLQTGFVIGTGNDNLNDTVSVNLSHVKKSNAPDDTLKIRYKIDGSCQKINNSLAKCYKIYIQGQNISKITDHFPASNSFKIPHYADVNRSIKVEVNNVNKVKNFDWTLQSTSPAEVLFSGNTLQVYDTQKVKISFFVDLNTYNVLQAKQTALDKVGQICQCGGPTCGLRKVFNTSMDIVDYACVYEEPDAPTLNPPEWFYISSKRTPHRYFDNIGAYHKEISSTTPAQEGTAFSYTNNDLLKPNNISSYIGFNEIYGSYSVAPGSSKPAMEIPVTFNQTYDLWIEQGSFSSCLKCGSEYYSNISRLFPNNFDYKGGGYLPHPTNTNKFISNPDHARADDHLFGRACFVPPTMIPWTHKPLSDPQQQRLNRLTAQHFLFANGYQRDWYGFDYGSIIGSFDGVRWFSIGNQRRIKATSNKLFVAINAYFGDLTTESSFRLLITLPSNVNGSEPSAKQDIESDGAQCQNYHTCVSDADCVTQLGWEYSCQAISQIRTNWPQFDQNAEEKPSSISSMEILKNILGNLGGSMKRCVYRGRGAPCKKDYKLTNSSTSYSGNTALGLHACNPNYYCQSFIDGVPVSKFNNKIARYGKSIKTQNANSTDGQSDADTFGLGTRVIGRPLKFYGDEEISPTAQENLSYNNVNSICLPGREPTHSNALTVKGQNSTLPASYFKGDQFNGIGMTPNTITMTAEMVNSCAILDDQTLNFTHLKDTSADLGKNLNDSNLTNLAVTQAIPTNAVVKIEEILGINNLLADYDSKQITEPILQKNRCLRAPGSVCHTDQDCAPTSLVSNAMNLIDDNDTTYTNLLNKYEINFWKEELICSQSESIKSPLYDLTRNRCCRETGKTITIGTLIDQSGDTTTNSELIEFDSEKIPGVHISLADTKRYSRISTYYKNMQDSSDDYPVLKTASPDKCSNSSSKDCMSLSNLEKQYKTLNDVSSKTCCSGHWVREFNQDQNGGGHRFGPDKTQTIPMTSFKCINWEKCENDSSYDSCSDNQFDCAHVPDIDDPKCLARSIGNAEANTIFKWLTSLELLGIPQIAVKTIDEPDIQCKVSPTDQSVEGSDFVIGDFIQTSTTDAEYEDANTNNRYFSADDSNNFSSSLKTIFSPDKIACCLPLGTKVKDSTVSPDVCCSGHYDSTTLNCNLPDYANVSLFFNRYVSSSLKNLPDGYFDPLTGFIKSSDVAIQLACQLKACASNKVAKGIALSNLKVAGHEDSEKNVRRFVDGDTLANQVNDRAKFFEAGLRWNNSIYCVPGDLQTSSQDMAVIDCL